MDSSGHNSPRRNQPNGYPQQYSRPGAAGQGSSTQQSDSLRAVQGSVNRAERFEDEKVRIMTSCFSKRDDKGALYQSYITHIRVEEDGMWPSDPPPASADPAYKKARVIIVAVKNTGRVYMHKARENEDNTFQIGKTWPLEELQRIESFSPEVDRGPDDAQRAVLGGPAGLVITMTKPYYWKAQTPKEKDFFIGSLCKIFRKYTGGTEPQLAGFSQRELTEILGVSQLQAPPSRPEAPRTSPILGQERPAARHRRPSDMSADSSMRSPSAASSGRQRPPSPLRHRNIAQGADRFNAPTLQPPPPGRTTTPQLRQRPSQETSLRSRTSHDQVRNGRLQAPGSGMASRASPQPSSMSSAMPSPSLRPDIPDGRLAPSRYPSEQPPSSSSENLLSSTTHTWRPQGPASRTMQGHMPTDSVASSNYMQSPGTPGQNGPQQLLPERRRPPLDESVYSPPSTDNARDDPSAVPKPLWSKPSKNEETRQRPAPEETPSQLDMRIPGAFGTASPTPTPPVIDTADLPTSKKSFLSAGFPNGQQSQPSSRPTTPHNNAIKSMPSGPADVSNDAASSPQENRPGLGPMVSKKLMSPNSGKNWGKAMKAATAASAFKPRAGGAGERLLASKTKNSNEPDGVTGVVPAPSKARGTSGEGTGPNLTADKLSSSGRHSLDTGDGYRPRTVAASPPFGAPLIEDDGKVDPWTYNQGRGDAGSTHSRQTSQAQQMRTPPPPSRYNESLATLGIDASTFDGRGRDYEATLAEFGWSSNILQTRTLESMEADLRKEVGRLEAGSWLGHTGQGDERVAHFEAALDRAIAECDEMEGLLTLYGVELSTLNDDIAYIESQSGGLQVQTANQKLLQTELQKLIHSNTGGSALSQDTYRG